MKFDDVTPGTVEMRVSRSNSPLVPVLVALCVILAGAVGFLLVRPQRGVPAPPRSVAEAPVAASPHDLLECLVCKQAVDPSTTPWTFEMKGHKVFFDRKECLEAFEHDPYKYAHVRYDVNVSKATPDAATPTAEASTTPTLRATGVDDVPPATPDAPPSAEDAPPATPELPQPSASASL